MEIQKLQSIFAKHPGVKALAKALETPRPPLGGEKAPSAPLREVIQLSGLQGSSAPLVFASLVEKAPQVLNIPYVFVLDDEEEAGYFYHDLTRLLGEEQVLFFPSSYKRAIKFGQRNAGQEILRTEVLSRLAAGSLPLFIVTHPQALSELVVTREKLSQQTLTLGVGERVDIMFVQETLFAFGFQRTDYVYEPGQFAVRGSIIDVYSFSHELPYRIDFFGDEVDSIRTFEVHSQLSRDRQQSISIVPEMTEQNLCRESFLTFLPENTIMVVKDLVFLCDMVEQTYNEGFSQSAIVEQQAANEQLTIDNGQLSADALLVQPEEFRKQIIDFRRIELKPSPTLIPIPYSLIQFNTHPQPVFHKNFDLLIDAFKKLQDEGTELYIRKVAPLGDPVEVTVRGYELSIRKADADMIEVAPVE